MNKFYAPFETDHIIVIGCGGIGMQVILNLARYMTFNEDLFGLPLTLVDGDEFEDRNKARQFFTKPGNKAASSSALLARLFPLLEVNVFPYYVAAIEDITEVNINTTMDVADLITEKSIVLVCVDNHPTRKLISRQAQALNDILVINGGNDLTDGSVHIYLKIDGEELLPTIEESDPSILEPAANAPYAADCIAAAMGGDEQLLFTNMTAASLMLDSLYVYSEGRLKTGTIQFDLFANQGGLIGPAAMLKT